MNKSPWGPLLKTALKNYSTKQPKKITARRTSHTAHIANLAIAIELEGDNIVTRLVFDAEENGGGFMLPISMWKERFYHKVR